jgi:hypothetical protein
MKMASAQGASAANATVGSMAARQAGQHRRASKYTDIFVGE